MVVLSIIVFVLVRLSPGDPALARLGVGFLTGETQEAIDAEREELGLDKPIVVQYLIWSRNLLTGDMGVDVRGKKPIMPLVWQKFKRTLPLAVSGVVLGVVVGISLGIIAGTRPFTWTDNVITSVSLFGVAAPGFWIGLLLILLFAVSLGWLPTHGSGPPGGATLSPKYFVLPTITIAISLVGGLTRYMRSGMLDVMSSDYIRTARAKGLSNQHVILRHALKNALLVVVTVIGLDLAGVLAGSIITETVFQWPGMGLLLVSAINNRDYGLIQVLTLFIALLYILINLVVDVTYAFLDPRIRFG